MMDPLDRQAIEEFNTGECDDYTPEERETLQRDFEREIYRRCDAEDEALNNPEREPDLRKFVADLKNYAQMLMGLGKETRKDENI